MRGAARALLITAACATGCARELAPPATPSPCATKPEAVREPELDVWPEPDWGAMVRAVEIRGALSTPVEHARAELGSRVGEPLDESRVAADLRALDALEVFEEVRAESTRERDGVRLVFHVRERRLIGRVEVRGLARVPVGRHLPLASGELFDPARVRRAAQGLEDHLVESGHLDARVRTEERRGAVVDVCLRVEAGPRWLVSELAMVGSSGVSERELLALVDDHDGKANRLRAPFRPDLVEPDRLNMLALYFDRGYLGATIGAPRAVRLPRRGALRVEWPVREGGVYRLSSIAFRGAARGREARYQELLGLHRGEVFSRAQVTAGLERLRAELGLESPPVPETELDEAMLGVKLVIPVPERAR